MSGIISYGSYIPYWRLQRATISGALGIHSGKGTRSVASYDEDPTSMGVEAARMALSALDGTSTRAVYFATTRPSYLEKTNATAIHAALDLDEDAFAADMIGSVRSGVAAIRAALDAPKPTLAVLSDIRTGLAGGSDEREGGDGAAALLCAAEGGFIAEYLGGATATANFSIGGVPPAISQLVCGRNASGRASICLWRGRPLPPLSSRRQSLPSKSLTSS